MAECEAPETVHWCCFFERKVSVRYVELVLFSVNVHQEPKTCSTELHVPGAGLLQEMKRFLLPRCSRFNTNLFCGPIKRLILNICAMLLVYVTFAFGNKGYLPTLTYSHVRLLSSSILHRQSLFHLLRMFSI